MPTTSGDLSLARFCDFENVALSVRDANYAKYKNYIQAIAKESIPQHPGILTEDSVQSSTHDVHFHTHWLPATEVLLFDLMCIVMVVGRALSS
jgi:hypothetical protein